MEAKAFLEEERRLNPGASHYVYAWIISSPYVFQKYSDDGEPQGTAGLPVLDALRQRQIEQAAIVVTRYFGGILLGTGRLSRAYGRAAALAIEAAGPIDCLLYRRFLVTIGYSDLDAFRKACRKENWWVDSPLFGIDVEVPVAVLTDQTERFQRLCADLTGGAALIQSGELVYLPLPPPDPPPDAL